MIEHPLFTSLAIVRTVVGMVYNYFFFLVSSFWWLESGNRRVNSKLRKTLVSWMPQSYQAMLPSRRWALASKRLLRTARGWRARVLASGRRARARCLPSGAGPRLRRGGARTCACCGLTCVARPPPRPQPRPGTAHWWLLRGAEQGRPRASLAMRSPGSAW